MAPNVKIIVKFRKYEGIGEKRACAQGKALGFKHMFGKRRECRLTLGNTVLDVGVRFERWGSVVTKMFVCRNNV